MAIEFARARFLSRSKGDAVVRSAAYNMRARLYAERTGETFKFRDHGTLDHHEVLLPADASIRFREPGALWNAADLAERRKDAQTAFEIVLALPADRKINDTERRAMARAFAQQYLVSQGLAVQLNIHRPHRGQTGAEETNYHAHLLCTVRRVEGDEFARLKARDIFPRLRRIFGRPIVVEAEQWGATWREFQNAWFREHRKPLVVEPASPSRQVHIGPRRFRHPFDPRIKHNERVRKLNLQARAKADMVPSGWRPLGVTDVARELSPDYAEQVSRAAKLEALIRKAGAVVRHRQNDIDGAKAAAAVRWGNMGGVRRALHSSGRWIDREMENQERRRRIAEFVRDKWSIKREAFKGDLAVTQRMAEAAFEKIRPAAERELARRQKVARETREDVDELRLGAVYKVGSYKRGGYRL